MQRCCRRQEHGHFADALEGGGWQWDGARTRSEDAETVSAEAELSLVRWQLERGAG